MIINYQLIVYVLEQCSVNMFKNTMDKCLVKTGNT